MHCLINYDWWEIVYVCMIYQQSRQTSNICVMYQNNENIIA